MPNMPHTRVARGKRVAVVLNTGQVVEGRFRCRPSNNRWVEIEIVNSSGEKEIVRIPKAEIVSFSAIKGTLDYSKLGIRHGTTKNPNQTRR